MKPSVLNVAPQSELKDHTIQVSKHKQHFFMYWERSVQLKAFFEWLPMELHDAPGIDWTKLPTSSMGYCVLRIGNSPDSAILAMALASALGAVEIESLYNLIKYLNNLLRTLRSTCKMTQISDLRNAQIWYDWLATKKKNAGTRSFLKAYSSISTGHFPSYLLRLDAPERLRMQEYALPPLPPDLLKKHLPAKGVLVAQQAARKGESDILVPLYPVLRQIVRLRKELAERVLTAISEARHTVESGEAELPFRFSHTDTIPELTRDATTISDVQVLGREVTMQFILWDKSTWVLEPKHKDRYSSGSRREAENKQGSYSPEKNCIFVQFDGNTSDLLWFGDLVEHRLFQQFNKKVARQAEKMEYNNRRQMARRLGFTNGCVCGSPGLLNLGDSWFSKTGLRNGEFIFEPESLYRGVLFGATLAMIALSNGSRMTELLQISWNHERRVTHTETMVILDENGQPCLDNSGNKLTRQVKLYFQHLLPKGSKTEEERQLFPLSKMCMRLLGEVKTMLEKVHGEVPIVAPSLSNSKYHDLKPERYIFQWATPTGVQGASITAEDVQVLLRFIVHGLELTTAQGKPILVSIHLLRHVMATHARQYRHVPPEVIAHFFLHHRLQELTGRAPSLSEVSEYYFSMTEQQRYAIIREDLEEQEELDRALMQVAPTPRDLEQKIEDLIAHYQQWHALHPTTFGNCCCPGLCPRENDRALCLGCPYLMEDAEKLGSALTWRTSYAQQAELLEAQGNFIDARHARIKLQQLDDVINVMRMQLHKEAEGSYIPIQRVLPSPHRKVEEDHEEES